MDYDELLQLIGEFGLFQRIVVILVSLVGIQASFSNMSIVFLAAVPAHFCKVPSLDHLDLPEDVLKNLTIPLDKDDFHKCKMFDRNYSSWTMDDVNRALYTDNRSDSLIDCQHGWVYDKSTYLSTIVTDFDLVCSREPLVATTQSAYMAGLMIGVILFGNISDVFGRRVGFAASLLMAVLFMIVTSFSKSYIAFTVLRFLLAMASISLFTVAFVIDVEFVGPEWRVFTGIYIEYIWAIGYMIIAGIAYAIRDWEKLQLAISVPMLTLLLVLLFVPESPRWLYAHHKHEKADPIVRKIAKYNKTEDKLPEKLDIKIEKAPKAYVWDLFRYPTLRIRTIMIYFIWFVNSLVYYGLSLNTSNLGGNPYINFLISAAVEIPAYLFCQLSLNRIGRRWPMGGSMILGGICLLLILAVPKTSTTWAVVLSTAGKLCISASFAIIYIFSAELFPTVVRNIGVGSGSFWARVGGIIAPQIARLSKYNRTIPLVVFGVCSVAAGIVGLFLPETKNRALPQTILEGEKFGKKSNTVEDVPEKPEQTEDDDNGKDQFGKERGKEKRGQDNSAYNSTSYV